MKYMLLIYDTASTREEMSGEAGAALMADMEALMRGAAPRPVSWSAARRWPTRRRRRPCASRDGVPAITDGPFAEAKEHLGGYLIVDCETPERATEIAARWPNAELRGDGGAAADGRSPGREM